VRRTKDKRFKKDYTKQEIIKYIQGVSKHIGNSPSSRELDKIPGPSSRTIIRRFGYWSKALKEAGIRPQTHQLMRGERSFIRENWRRMTDKEIAEKLGVTHEIIKYYRANYSLWKNKKGTAKSTFRKEALKLYGKKCEVCSIKICEWHHIIPKSKEPDNWCVLCPLCHSVITRKFVTINNREELKTKLLPYMRIIYKDLRIHL